MALDLPPLDAEAKDYDYKVRCEELEAALNETRSALDEFQLSSRELEAELEKELENMEKQYKEAKRQKERLKMESDEWKSKFQQAKNDQTQTTNAMQKEIDALREAQKLIQNRLREMEMSNDDMERNDRVVKSSLEDLQQKYDKSTEEVALLQAEVASSETLRIENQRLKDELRELKEEFTILKDKAAHVQTATEGSPSPRSQRHHTPPSPPISDGSRALTPSSEALTSPPKVGSLGLGGIGGTGTWRGVPRRIGKRLSIASDVDSWTSEARQTSSVKVMHDMVSRVKKLEARLQACRDLVNPLLDTSPIKDPSSPTKQLFLTSPEKSPEKSPDKDYLPDLPRLPQSRPQSQLSNYSERYRSLPAPRTPSGSRRLTFGRPKSRQSLAAEEAAEDEGDITITLENSAFVTPRRTRHHKTISSPTRSESRLSIRSVSQDEALPPPVMDGVFKRPESATGRRQSGIPTPSVERRTSGIPAPRRQSGIPSVGRPGSPERSTSSSSFHSDTLPSASMVVSPGTSHGSMGAPTGSMIPSLLARRQSGATSALPLPKQSGIPLAGRKSGTGIPLPR